MVSACFKKIKNEAVEWDVTLILHLFHTSVYILCARCLACITRFTVGVNIALLHATVFMCLSCYGADLNCCIDTYEDTKDTSLHGVAREHFLKSLYLRRHM